MRKQYFPLIFGLMSLMLMQQQALMAQDFAYVPPPLYQGHENGRKELKSVLVSLEKKFGVYFTFESQVIRNKFIPSEVRITDNLEETLANVLNPFNLRFKKLSDKYYTIYPREEQSGGKETKKDFDLQGMNLTDQVVLFNGSMTPALQTLQITVSGAVTDENNESLPGVNVMEKGTNNGTTSDASGRYTINVKDENSVLVFSFIGYTAEEVPVSGRSVIDIALTPSVQSLEEVVVIGYGTVDRKDLTGSVGSVGSQDIKDLSVTRVDQALLGKAAGVQVKPVSGEPGAAPKIMIRGIGSISAGSDPLYVVDGFPTANIDMLNPNDIESIDILKDASATAIYGSRGANGVIIINTKRGKQGKTQITFDTYIGWQKVARRPDMMNARESAQYSYDGIRNNNLDLGNDVSGPPSTWPIKVPQVSLDVLEGRNTYDRDALDDVLRTAPQQQYQLSASGGNENVKYSVSGQYMNQDGIVINNNFKRYSMRANLDVKMSERLSMKLNINPSFTNSNVITASGGDDGANSEGIIGQALYIHNFYPLYVDAAGNAVKENGDYFVFSGLEAQGAIVNPLAIANEIKAVRRKAGFLGNINLEYKILDDLKFNVLLGSTITNTRASKFKPQLPVFFNALANGRDESAMDINWLTEYTLSYNKSFSNHNIAAVGGFTVQKDLYENNFLQSDKYPNNLVPTLSAVSGILSNGTSERSEWSMLSYLGRVNYNYNGKYYVTASIRTDGSSRFGADKKWGVFPSAALAWRVSDENFLKDVRFISELKLRASYGETGNNNIGNYEHQSTISYLLYPVGGVASGGYAPQRIANPLLTWETQRQVNAGIDLSIFEGRLNLAVDHFQSRNTDLLLNVTIPAITGFNTKLKNIGEVKNTGWEFTLSSVNTDGAFKWTTDFNISTYKNEVMKLGPNGDPIYAGGSITQIGQPIGMFYGWLTDGIFMSQAELDQGPIFHPGANDRSRPGDVRFVDISGPAGVPDGIIDGLDKTIMGSPYPDFYYGMTNKFSYKNISLTVTLQGVQGNDVFALTRGTIANSRARYRQLSMLNNYWKSEEEPGDGNTPRPNNAPSGNFRGTYSQRWLDDGSYLRISNISLGYQFPVTLAGKLKLNALKVYATATNPFIFTKYHGFNPDVNNSANSLTPGVDLNDYPLQKSFIVGFNAAF